MFEAKVLLGFCQEIIYQFVTSLFRWQIVARDFQLRIKHWPNSDFLLFCWLDKSDFRISHRLVNLNQIRQTIFWDYWFWSLYRRLMFVFWCQVTCLSAGQIRSIETLLQLGLLIFQNYLQRLLSLGLWLCLMKSKFIRTVHYRSFSLWKTTWKLVLLSKLTILLLNLLLWLYSEKFRQQTFVLINFFIVLTWIF